MGEVFSGAGNSSSAEDVMRWCKGDKIAVEHLFSSAERGVNVGNEGLLVSGGEKKVRTCWVTSLQHHWGQKYSSVPRAPLGRDREDHSEGCLVGPALPCCCHHGKGRVGFLVHPRLP